MSVGYARSMEYINDRNVDVMHGKKQNEKSTIPLPSSPQFVLMVGLTGIRTGLGFIGRSAEESFFDKSDLLYLTTYLVSDGIERYDCLNRLACLDDRKAERLLTTSKMMINGAKYLQP